MSSHSGHRISRSNQGILFYDTVQTSWRPQLPLPKEIPASRAQNSSTMEKNAKKEAANAASTNNKKWSFGRFFRKKKDLESDSSSDDDHKAGFAAATAAAQKPRKKDKRKRSISKITSPAFDHIVINPKNENEIFLPFETIEIAESLRSSGSADRGRGRRDRKQRSGRMHVQHTGSSSDEEIKSHNSSLNSSTLPRYRSDESIGSGGVIGSRRSRAARTERYYKRLSRDENGNMQNVGLPQSGVGRWKTQPVQFNNYDYNRSAVQGYHLKNSGSLNSVPNGQHWNYAVPQKVPQSNAVSSEKRSVSYDNHIHLQNMNMSIRRDPAVVVVAKNPPPPPPRDPLRRVHVPGQPESRPMSYAFDKSMGPVYSMNSRCVSDDKLWGPEGSVYQLNIQRPASAQPPAPQMRRFITRAERDANHNQIGNYPMGPEYKYVADAIPRSRKPIHIVKSDGAKIEASPNSAFVAPPSVIRTTKSGLPSPMKTACEFWKQIEQQESQRRGRVPDRGDKSRSISSSRANDGLGHRLSAYESFKNSNSRMNKSVDEVDTIVNGSLFLKPTKDNEEKFLEVSTKPYESKSNSMPNYYQQQRQAKKVTATPSLNKYEEYIARKAPQTVVKPVKYVPPPPQRKSLKVSDEDLRKPATNLEDAINELEAIYKSLRLGDEDLLDRAERRDIPTPTDFKKYAVESDENDDDEDQSTGEPDVVLDDVAYRNIKHANSMIKTVDPQPPFGIPIVPVPPSPNTDYLHVTPDADTKKNRCVPHNIPDLVSDDLAVRTLRKDVPGSVKPAVAFPNGQPTKKRAVRSMSANIYNMIQRNAAKPSGGSIYDYVELDRALEKAGSLSDIRREVDDVPATLNLLRNIHQQERDARRKTSPIFRHPSQGGAVFNLPSTLTSPSREDSQLSQKPPVPLPRKSISPEPVEDTRSMEEVLNRIAKEARESSEKLSRDLLELRNEKRLMAKKSMKPEMEKLSKDIETVSSTAKKYEEVIADVVPPSERSPTPKPRKVLKEEKLLRDIDGVSEAAKACERILQDVVTIEPPVIVETAKIVQPKSSEVEDFLGRKGSPMVPAAPESDRQKSEEPAEVDLIEFSEFSESDVEPKPEKLVLPSLLKQLDPIHSEQVSSIAERCMRQISELNDLKDEPAAIAEANDCAGDYDNLIDEIDQPTVTTSTAITCKEDVDDIPDYDNIDDDCAVVSEQKRIASKAPLASHDEEDIDTIMKECEYQVHVTPPYASLSSSDCPKSSSTASSRHQSSSITSIHAFSSSDYVKSSSSELQTPSTDPIKTFSTTSYDVNSSSVTPNPTNSPISTSPSPLLARTPISNEIVENSTTPPPSAQLQRSRSQSQYNSSEELAMIFGIPPTTTAAKPVAIVPSVAIAPAKPTTNAVGAAVTTGNVKTLDELRSNSCAIVANNQNVAITTTTSATTTINSFVVVDVAGDALTTTASDSITPICMDVVATNAEDCVADCENDDSTDDLHQSQHGDVSFITVASLRTPDFCSPIRLLSSANINSGCLDTIPEVHDTDEVDADNEDDDVIFVDENVLVHSFTNTENCMFPENADIDEEHRTSLSSNPDSGNVSLSDFPIHQQQQSQQDLSASIKLSLLQNTDITYSNSYSFVNRIKIDTCGDRNKVCDRDEPFESEAYQVNSNADDNFSNVGENLDNRGSETKNSTESAQNSLNHVQDPSFLRSRHSTIATPTPSGGSSSSCGASQPSASELRSNGKQTGYLTNSQTRNNFIHHLMIACTGACGVGANDFYTIVAIALAVIILMAVLLI